VGFPTVRLSKRHVVVYVCRHWFRKAHRCELQWNYEEWGIGSYVWVKWSGLES